MMMAILTFMVQLFTKMSGYTRCNTYLVTQVTEHLIHQ